MDITPTKVYEKTNPITGGNIDTTLPYRFEQSASQVFVYIPFETKPVSRTLDIRFTNKQLIVGKKGSSTFIINGELAGNIKPNDSTWYIEDNNVVIVLEKRVKVWFPCVMKGDPEIDVSKITIPLLEYSDLCPEQQKQIPELYAGVPETMKRKAALQKRREDEKNAADDKLLCDVSISSDAAVTTITSKSDVLSI